MGIGPITSTLPVSSVPQHLLPFTTEPQEVMKPSKRSLKETVAVHCPGYTIFSVHNWIRTSTNLRSQRSLSTNWSIWT